MASNPSKQPDPASLYRQALESYLREDSEAALLDAYALGRRLLNEGRGMLPLIDIHHRMLAGLLTGVSPDRLLAAGHLLAESLASFEMSLRGFSEANSALRSINQRLEDELRKIAHALHDESGQLLTCVFVRVDQARKELSPSATPFLDEVRDMLEAVETQLRRLSHELRPTILDDLGLGPALDFLAQGIAARSGIGIQVEDRVRQRLPPAFELALYRSAQEGLNNLVRHARATRARLALQADSQHIELKIEDNGCGFDPRQAGSGHSLGLLGMRERVRSLGGEMQIESKPGAGTTISLSLPLPAGGHYGAGTIAAG